MMDKFLNKNQSAQTSILSKIFYELETSHDSPYSMAMTAYEAIKSQAKSGEELFYFLIEDAMFTSLYATFYEQLLTTASSHPEHALALIEKFASEADQRERVIATQSQNHFNFIENYGMCEGCQSCDNHADVAELIAPFQKGDIDFFTELFIGMQTIQFAMEALIFDILPDHPEFLEQIDQNSIINWRQTIYSYAQLKASEI